MDIHTDCVSPESSRDPSDARGDAKVRLRGLAVGASCWALLAVAAALTPSGRGYGTHRQLGLPACSVPARTGYPCPSCGLTTSLAAMAEGDVAAAFDAHPFGLVLFAATVIAAVAGTAELVRGRALLTRMGINAWWALGGSVGLLAGWGLKLALMSARGELPLH